MLQTPPMLSQATRQALNALAALDPQDPSCPPDWRMRRAQIGMAAGLSASQISGEDAVLTSLVRFLVKRAKAEEEGTLEKVKKKNPAMYAAVELGRTTSIVATRIQAMILAGTPRAEIAERAGYAKATASQQADVSPACSLGESIIQLYEELFFDVRSRLENKGFITSQVLRLEDGWRLPSGTFVLGLGWYGGLGGVGLKLLDEYEAIDPKNGKLLEDFAKAIRAKCRIHTQVTVDYAKNPDAIRSQLYETQIQKLEQEMKINSPNEQEAAINRKITNLVEGLKLSIADITKPVTSAVDQRACEAARLKLEAAVDARRGLAKIGGTHAAA